MFCLASKDGPNLIQLIEQMQRPRALPPQQKEPVYPEDDIKILMATYPNSGAPACAELMPHHSLFSIHHMAQRMGLKNRPTWDEVEKTFLKTAISSGTSIKLMVEQLTGLGFHRTYGGTKQKVREIRTAAS